MPSTASVGGTKIGQPPSVPRQAATRESTMSAPGLGGIFAAGTPTLRRTGLDLQQTDPSTAASRQNTTTAAVHSQDSNQKIDLMQAVHLARYTILIHNRLGTPSSPSGHGRIPPPRSGGLPKLPASPIVPPPMILSKSTAPIASNGASRASSQAISETSPYNTIRAMPAPPRPHTQAPSLPSAPPPPLPGSFAVPIKSSTADLSLPRSLSTQYPAPGPPVPPTSHSAGAFPISVFGPVEPRQHSSSDNTKDLPFAGLQAALAIRTHGQPDEGTKTANFNGDTTDHESVAKYSLKAQNVKRVDDSRYKFQLDSTLPPIRNFKNCRKTYRSGRPSGNTVPLNTEALR